MFSFFKKCHSTFGWWWVFFTSVIFLLLHTKCTKLCSANCSAKTRSVLTSATYRMSKTAGSSHPEKNVEAQQIPAKISMEEVPAASIGAPSLPLSGGRSALVCHSTENDLQRLQASQSYASACLLKCFIVSRSIPVYSASFELHSPKYLVRWIWGEDVKYYSKPFEKWSGAAKDKGSVSGGKQTCNVDICICNNGIPHCASGTGHLQ